MSSRVLRRTRSAAVVVVVLGAATLLAEPAQGLPVRAEVTVWDIGSTAWLEVDGVRVDTRGPLPAGSSGVVVNRWVNNGTESAQLGAYYSGVDLEVRQLWFGQMTDRQDGSMRCDEPAFDYGVVTMQPGDAIECRSTPFTVPEGAVYTGGLLNGPISLDGQWMITGGTTVTIRPRAPQVDALDGAVWRGGVAVTEAEVGDRLVYTFDVRNVGNVEVDLTATDSLGLAYTCEDPVLGRQESTSCTSEEYLVAEADAEAGQVTDAEAVVTGLDEYDGATVTDATALPVVLVGAPTDPATPTPTPAPALTAEPTPAPAETSDPTAVPTPGEHGTGDGAVTAPAGAPTPTVSSAPLTGATLATTGTPVVPALLVAIALVVLGGACGVVPRRR